MNGLITNNCCCEEGDCCQVAGPEPYWYNRYRFTMSGVFSVEYIEGECQSAIDPCVRCPEPAGCGGPGHEGDCIPCLRRSYLSASATGIIYRHPLFHPGPPGPGNCATDAENVYWEWVASPTSVCSASVYSPPDYGIAVGGITSNYVSPPCDCGIAADARVRWTGQDVREDVSGCYDGCPFEGPFYNNAIGCFGSANLTCYEGACHRVNPQTGIPEFPCCSSSPSDTRYHHFTVRMGQLPNLPGTCDCTNGITLVYAARLSATVGPHLASWELVSAPSVGCQGLLSQLPCNERGCCDPENDLDETDECGPCGGFECGEIPGNPYSCKVCREDTITYPSIQFIPEP